MDTDEKIRYYRRQLAARRSHRFRRGKKEYGHQAFLIRSGVREDVKEEIADCMNWLELLYVKVCMMETGEL